MTDIPGRVLVVSPHGDDVTLFAGGTVAIWARAGCEVSVIRVTNDEKDSFDLPVAETAAVNRAEFGEAMKALGVSETRHLNFRDCELLDIPHGELRGLIIRAIREFKPEIVMSFDPMEQGDENPDHSVVARAAADASWAAGYPNFHPEHLDAGLKPHCPLGNYYFTRHFTAGETLVDIEPVIELKIRAVQLHRNMMRTVMADQLRRIRQSGLDVPAVSKLGPDDYEDYWEKLVRGSAMLAAQGSEFMMAERFRSTLLSGEDPLVQFLGSLG